MKIDLSNKIAIVTGAGGNLGEGIVDVLASCGADIAVTDISFDAAEATAFKISSKYNIIAKPYKLDISDEEEVKGVFAQINSDFSRIDILVANAGVAGEGANYYQTPMDDARRIIDVNLHGTGICIKAALDYMLPQKYGKIVTISSIAGRTGTVGTPNYSISKAAIIALTQSVARAHAKEGINVNCICPGYIYTDMWKKGVEKYSKFLNKTPEETWKQLALDRMATGRAQEPEDIGYAVAFFASELSMNITGQTLNVCGGAKFN